MSDSPVDKALDDDTTAARRGRFGWISITVAVVFGLFYAYELWEALGNLLAFPDEVFTGTKLVAKPWALLGVNFAIPVLVYVAALLLGRKRNAFLKAVLFVVGLCIVAVLSLDITALIFA
jgi:hypothetical protein